MYYLFGFWDLCWQKDSWTFGHTLSGPDSGIPSGRLENIWYRVVKLSSKLDRFPGVSVGRKFVRILANEIHLLDADND